MEEKKEERTVTARIASSGTTVILVWKVTIGARQDKCDIMCSGTIEPEVVIIDTPPSRKVFRASGEEVPLDRIARDYPDVVPVLEQIDR